MNYTLLDRFKGTFLEYIEGAHPLLEIRSDGKPLRLIDE